ncbi:hypothetical protein R1sor_006448 [Riccia sorocarpa]|uniref:Reverse transcriptase zinc-binding domain-containing protein n=1 Tax=Riccia sorocarpa TaxID=122646 RepID=A0ABD3HQG3_9MARC
MEARLQDLPSAATWSRVAILSAWSANSKTLDNFLVSWEDKQALIAALRWRDQTGFLTAPYSNIRRLTTTDTGQVQKRLQKWALSHGIDLHIPRTWHILWHKDKPVKHSILQWYIIYQALPTNLWRNPQISRADPETWCPCCENRQAEDIQHLFWNCSAVRPIWVWAIEVLHIAFPETRRWSLQFHHAVLGDKIPDYCKTARKWWERRRLLILWTLWIQKNHRIFRNTPPSTPRTKAMAWQQLLVRTRADWNRHCRRANSTDLTLARRRELNKVVANRLAITTLRMKISGQRLVLQPELNMPTIKLNGALQPVDAMMANSFQSEP